MSSFFALICRYTYITGHQIIDSETIQRTRDIYDIVIISSNITSPAVEGNGLILCTQCKTITNIQLYKRVQITECLQLLLIEKSVVKEREFRKLLNLDTQLITKFTDFSPKSIFPAIIVTSSEYQIIETIYSAFFYYK